MWRFYLVLVLSLASTAFLSSCSDLPHEHPLVTARNGEISIPVKEVSDGKVHFFTYRSSGKRLNFFVRSDGTGNLSTYFDACLTCYKHKKGYREEGTDLVCNECNLKFKLADERWDSSHACCPIMLRSTVTADAVIISTADLEKGARLF